MEKTEDGEHRNEPCKGALAAEEKVGAEDQMSSFSARYLKRVMSLLSCHAFTDDTALSDEGWRALEVMINEKQVRERIPKLKKAGASGIVEYPLNKVIP